MKTTKVKEISVFIASPGDLASERKVFKDTIDSLNAGFADGAGVKFIPLAWEDVLATTGRRTQSVIDREIEQCDLFILALHRRWGQPAPDSKFSSYTEEEFQLALNRWKETKSPEVLVFFKSVDNASIADPGPELAKVLTFRKNLEEGRVTLIRTFNTEVDFGTEVDRHLRAFARGEWKDLDDNPPVIDLPRAEITALGKATREGAKRLKDVKKQVPSAERRSIGREEPTDAMKADLSLVMAHQAELALARAAVDAAHDGRRQDAAILFAKATEGTTDLSILSLAAEFFRQVGDPENAGRLVRRQAAIARDRTIAARHYFALLPKGWAASMVSQILTQMLAQFPPEMAEEIQSISEEVWGGGRLEKFTFDLYVKHFSAAELVVLSRMLGTPEGQSALQKQAVMMKESMEFGAREFQRVFEKRHPDGQFDISP